MKDDGCHFTVKDPASGANQGVRLVMLEDSARERIINAVFAQIKMITEVVVHAGNAVITGKYDAPTAYVTTIGSAIEEEIDVYETLSIICS